MLVRNGPKTGVLELRLDRPTRLNALDVALVRAITDAVHEAQSDAQVRALLLTGAGRAFCSGKDRDAPASMEFVDALQQLAAALLDSPKPVVAAAQGWAVGAGLEMLLNCDIVLAADDARFLLPEAALGLLGTNAIHALLPRKIGMARAKALLLLGGEFSARDAEQWGLLWALSPPEQLQARALEIARRLASTNPHGLATTKALLHREAFVELQPVLDREAAAHRKP